MSRSEPCLSLMSVPVDVENAVPIETPFPHLFLIEEEKVSRSEPCFPLRQEKVSRSEPCFLLVSVPTDLESLMSVPIDVKTRFRSRHLFLFEEEKVSRSEPCLSLMSVPIDVENKVPIETGVSIGTVFSTSTGTDI